MNEPLITFEDVVGLGGKNPLITADIVSAATRCQNKGQLKTRDEALSYAWNLLYVAGEVQ